MAAECVAPTSVYLSISLRMIHFSVDIVTLWIHRGHTGSIYLWQWHSTQAVPGYWYRNSVWISFLTKIIK